MLQSMVIWTGNPRADQIFWLVSPNQQVYFLVYYFLVNGPFVLCNMSLADSILRVTPVTLPRHLTSFVQGQTPMSTTPVVLSTLAGYLVTIFGIQAAMKNRPPQKLNALFQIHNVFLSSGSLLLLVLMAEEIVPIIWKRGFYNALCSAQSWTPRLEFYYMINYYFKYIELIDTVFLAFKKKTLAFLHVFHHSATALLCYSQLLGQTSIVNLLSPSPSSWLIPAF
ncbi:unnamed protein product [Mycena citricolor]|uniref:Elongation of fatty acids protein n=1 Tax=Mycena citricolor TaxID=2018698 RepID=A0AAD2GWM8_9AGAR|nr:unnamed protein product [Mycena citricolor]CAK5280223.1 unnamed protein product [Mycena citricolor]